jgi:tRNA pseudouridine13 synthase
MLRMYLSAWQSAIFNVVLDDRIAAGTLGTLLPGDLAIKSANGAVFAVSDEIATSDDTRDRLARFELAPSGPMWGSSMPSASGDAGLIETQALAATGVSLDALQTACQKLRVRVEGERRALRVQIIDPEVEGGLDEHGPYIRLAFELPKGSYATALLAEVMKPDDAQPA